MRKIRKKSFKDLLFVSRAFLWHNMVFDFIRVHPYQSVAKELFEFTHSEPELLLTPSS